MPDKQPISLPIKRIFSKFFIKIVSVFERRLLELAGDLLLFFLYVKCAYLIFILL